MKKLICIVAAICTLTFVGCANNNNKVSSTNEKKVLASDSSVKKDVNIANKNISKSEPKKNETTPVKDKASEVKVESLKTTPVITNENPAPVAPVPAEPETTPAPEPEKSIYPSEPEIMNFIKGAENALTPIFKGPALYSKNPLIINNVYYGEVTNFNSREEMADSLRGYFTEDVINSILDKYLLEKDGKLYFTIGQAGLRVNYDSCTKNFSYDNNKIIVKLSSNYSNSPNDIVTETKTLEFINGQWLFTNFWYV